MNCYTLNSYVQSIMSLALTAQNLIVFTAIKIRCAELVCHALPIPRKLN